MPGNTNTYLANVNDLSPPIVASKVRFVPHSGHKRTVCMRVEVFGCLYEDGIVSYSAPPGDEFAPNLYIEDVYDGDEQTSQQDGPKLINGLGVLTDGLFGGNVTLLESGLSSGKHLQKAINSFKTVGADVSILAEQVDLILLFFSSWLGWLEQQEPPVDFDL